MGKKPYKKIDLLYEEICQTYFPRWNPWAYTYDPKLGDGGCCNTKTKRIFFGNPDPKLIIHEICHAVTPGHHGSKWQERMIKASEIAKQHDPVLSKRITNDKNISSKTTKLSRVYFYNSLADTFYTLYSENEPTTINIDHCITYLLGEAGIWKECGEQKQYSQMLNRGRKIAAQQLKLVQ
jgi:hypothetical protein